MWQGDLTFDLSSHGELADGSRLCREARRTLMVHSGLNSKSWEWREDKQSWVDAVPGVCCTRCMLYSVYAGLGVNSWSWHGEIERDDWTLCSAMMVELWTRKREMGMKMRTMCRIRADMRNQGYHLPDWVGNTSYRCNYTPDRDLYLLYRGWYIDSHTKFS